MELLTETLTAGQVHKQETVCREVRADQQQVTHQGHKAQTDICI